MKRKEPDNLGFGTDLVRFSHPSKRHRGSLQPSIPEILEMKRSSKGRSQNELKSRKKIDKLWCLDDWDLIECLRVEQDPTPIPKTFAEASKEEAHPKKHGAVFNPSVPNYPCKLS